MSYVRMNAESDVYLIGTTAGDGVNTIECCGCKLTEDVRKPQTPEEFARVSGVDTSWAGMRPEEFTWNWGPHQEFRTKADAMAHLDQHRTAGHKVPECAYDNVREDWWVGTRNDEQTRKETQ